MNFAMGELLTNSCRKKDPSLKRELSSILVRWWRLLKFFQKIISCTETSNPIIS
jgi:hypothetical protein